MSDDVNVLVTSTNGSPMRIEILKTLVMWNPQKP